MLGPTPCATSSAVFPSPLRYPGGKGRLGPWLGHLIEQNNLRGGTYVEPYAGGAGAALFLLQRGFVGRIVINDADPVVYKFWKVAVHQSQRLIDLIEKRPATLETRNWTKEILAAPGNYREPEIAFATFFLNRVNRSGILKGGVIGGKAQAGDYKLDARYNPLDLIERIRAIGQLRERITVTGLDALELLEKRCPRLPKKSLIYLDPPYYIKGSQLYRNFYDHADHAAIAEATKQLAHPVLVTYDDCSPIRKLYHGVRSASFSLQYSTHLARPMASEVMFYANLTLPMAPVLTRGNAIRTQRRKAKVA
ncbi:DNA adenine methylase [Luteibacter sp. 3190]|uniref:DNA adenine methylase n=1 Tax=Luteibacter sp. 3190 TaxID=2817736 RepID=UPI0028603531|nr:DNA adenine methylase [Luteibacter sp. 3190]MDR6935357.1 DNA adenine methylase [Luteibacter sp. 3190]